MNDDSTRTNANTATDQRRRFWFSVTVGAWLVYVAVALAVFASAIYGFQIPLWRWLAVYAAASVLMLVAIWKMDEAL